MTLLAMAVASTCILSDTIEHLLYRMAGHRPDRYFRFVVPAVMLYGLSLGFWLWLLRLVPLGVAAPFMAASHVTIAIVSRAVLGEQVNRWRWAGIVLVAAGVAVLAANGG